MIIVRIKGGLGNQLFQYAAAYSLSIRLHQTIELDTSFYPMQTLRGFKLESLMINNIGIASKIPIAVEVYKNRYINKVLRKLNYQLLPYANQSFYLLETRSDILTDFFTVSYSNLYLEGYYQSELYFKQYRNEILKQFQPTYEPEPEYSKQLALILSTSSIAVHVRRGDFLNAQHDHNPNHYLLAEKYYRNALKYMDEHVSNPVYYWFSDDIDWVKQNFGEHENFRFVSLHTKHADIDEMMLMKNCHHIIAANSTFSWWASWLNEHEDAIHLCPAKRYGNARMIPDNWIKIPIE